MTRRPGICGYLTKIPLRLGSGCCQHQLTAVQAVVVVVVVEELLLQFLVVVDGRRRCQHPSFDGAEEAVPAYYGLV